MPNEVAMTNSNGAGMNLRRSTERTIGAEGASVKIADAWTTRKAPFITAVPLFITGNALHACGLDARGGISVRLHCSLVNATRGTGTSAYHIVVGGVPAVRDDGGHARARRARVIRRRSHL